MRSIMFNKFNFPFVGNFLPLGYFLPKKFNAIEIANLQE